MTVSLEGMDEGVAGRGFMKERGVLGGSMFGITFFQASTKVESSVGAAGRSVEYGLALDPEEDIKRRARRPVARRNMAWEEWGRSALAGWEREEGLGAGCRCARGTLLGKCRGCLVFVAQILFRPGSLC